MKKTADVSNIKSKGNTIIENLLIDIKQLPNDPLFEKTYGIKTLPLSEVAKIEMNIKLPVQYVNAIRRGIDESVGYSLNIEMFDFSKSTDVFIIYQLLHLTIANLSIKQFECGSEFELDVENKTDERIRIMSRDIKLKGTKTPIDICNPNITIAVLNPGKRLKIPSIKVISGLGKDNARFQPFHSVGYIPNLPQIKNHIERPKVVDGVSDKEQIRLVDSSGFKESSFLVKATEYKLCLTMSAIANKSECVMILKRIIKSIIDRLEYSLTKIETEQCEIKNDELHLVLFNETSTIGELIVRSIEVKKAVYFNNIQGDKLIINLIGSNVKSTLIKCINTIITNYNIIIAEI